MYNGIGLKTARGTGTNGYVQRNLSNFKPRDNPFDKRKAGGSSGSFNSDVRHTQPDAAILEHERKRRVEVKCMELRVQLEDDDVEEDEIELQVSALREKLVAQLEQEKERDAAASSYSRQEASKLRPGDTHKLLQAKQHEDRRFASAVGVDSGYREGDAFDRELQERKKQERIEERRKADEQRRLDWERKKELQQQARRDREREQQQRARSSRDDGWAGRDNGRSSRNRSRYTDEIDRSLSRSPSPRAKKRSRRAAESDSESYSSDSGSDRDSRRRRSDASRKLGMRRGTGVRARAEGGLVRARSLDRLLPIPGHARDLVHYRALRAATLDRFLDLDRAHVLALPLVDDVADARQQGRFLVQNPAQGPIQDLLTHPAVEVAVAA